MGGKPCIRGMRITVGTIVGLVAGGRTVPEILAGPPNLEHIVVSTIRTYASELHRGAIVTIDESRRKVRILPIR